MSGVRFIKPYERTNATEVFYGINKGARIPDGYFSDTLNMTSSKYPCIATRAERKRIVYDADVILPGEPREAVAYADGIIIACSNGNAMYKDKVIDVRGEVRNIIPFGNSVYFAPAGVLADSEGNIEFSRHYSQLAYSVSYCDSSSENIEVSTGEKPSSPTAGQYWYDSYNKGLYRFDSATEDWIAVPTIYIKATVLEGDVPSLNVGDAVRITTVNGEYESFVSAVFNDSIVFEGVFDSDIISEGISLAIERRFPVLSYACSHNNRVWGCNYDGNLNEIYASKLGDPLNWYSYRGLSTDSYAVSCGEHGKFTGCSELGDTVVFFKENCIYTVYGTEPSNFQTVKTDCYGVQEDSENSICRINGSVYYKSCHGIMRLSEGSLPVSVSEVLGADKWSAAVAGTDGRRYYIAMTDLSGEREMYVFDTYTDLWHKEELPCENFFAFCNYKNNLLCIGKKSTGETAEPVKKGINAGTSPERKDYENDLSFNAALMKWVALSLAGAIMMEMTYEEIKQSYADNNDIDISEISDADVISYMKTFLDIEETEKHFITTAYISNEVTCNAYLPAFSEGYVLGDEGRFLWQATTGIRGLSLSESKRLKSLDIRMKVSAGARCDVCIKYDEEDEWNNIATFDTEGMRTFRMKARHDKCDCYRLQFKGYGNVVIFSIGETYEEAGNSGF